MTSPYEVPRTEQKPYPHVPPALLAYLEELFPDQCPKVTDSDREIWMAVGARRVVDHLRFCHDEQSESSAQEHITRV